MRLRFLILKGMISAESQLHPSQYLNPQRLFNSFAHRRQWYTFTLPPFCRLIFVKLLDQVLCQFLEFWIFKKSILNLKGYVKC